MQRLPYLIFSILLICGSVFCHAQKQQNSFLIPGYASDQNYDTASVIFKLKPAYRHLASSNSIEFSALNKLLNHLQFDNLQKLYPNHQPPQKRYDKYGHAFADLSLIYKLHYQADIPVNAAIIALSKLDIFEYVQASVSNDLLFVPNDLAIGEQYHLNVCKLFDAWDITQGDTNVVIGITDTGTWPSNSDLSGNIHKNYADPIDGIDNDNDGFTDNYLGWDVAENDNDVTINYGGHGSFVSGISSATPNDSFGIAGVGYNCHYLPVKINISTGKLVNDYQAIVYAADHGAQIINCSWGGKLSAGPYGQDVITYASINKNALVVAACGNDSSQIEFFPASYEYVYAVAASDSNDHIAPFSSFYNQVDLIAPGHQVYSAFKQSYFAGNGTSYAAPVVSGVAALVKSYRPYLSGIQLGEQLKVSADVIDTIAYNTPYQGLIGSGRVNAEQALLKDTIPGIVARNISIDDYQSTVSYDTIVVDADFTNYLSPSTNLKVYMTTNSIYVQAVKDTLNIGVLATMATFNGTSQKLKLVVFPNVPDEHEVEICFHFIDDFLSSKQYVNKLIKPDYLNIQSGRIFTSLTSNSQLGWSDHVYGYGIGFSNGFNKSYLSQGGLMLGNSNTHVVDNLFDMNSYNTDFVSVERIHEITNPVKGDRQWQTIYEDQNAGSRKLNVRVIQNTYAWDSSLYDGFIIKEYLVVNKGSTMLNDLYAGLFCDWDLPHSWGNTVSWDASRNMGYTESLKNGFLSGVRMLYPQNAGMYAFDNDGADGSIQLTDGFPVYEKYDALSTSRLQAGTLTGLGNDVSQLVNSPAVNIAPGDTAKFVFAIVIGNHQYDLRTQSDFAKALYDYVDDTALNENTEAALRVFPNPVENTLHIQCSGINFQGESQLEIRDINGKLIKTCTQSTNYSTIDVSDLAHGVYQIIIRNKQNIYRSEFIR